MTRKNERNEIRISRKESIQNLVSSMVLSGVFFGIAYLMKTELFRILLCLPGAFFGFFVIVWAGIAIRIYSEKRSGGGIEETKLIAGPVEMQNPEDESVTNVTEMEGSEVSEPKNATTARHRTYSPLCEEGLEEDSGG